MNCWTNEIWQHVPSFLIKPPLLLSGVLLLFKYDNSSWPASEIIYMVVPFFRATAFLPFVRKMSCLIGIPNEALSSCVALQISLKYIILSGES